MALRLRRRQDDHREPEVRKLICAILADGGYDLLEAHDGAAALEALGRFPVGLAVLDISMPGMSGIEVYEEALKRGWRGKVLFVSGFTDPTDFERIRGKPFLAKPFGAHAFKERIAAISADLRKERASPQA